MIHNNNLKKRSTKLIYEVLRENEFSGPFLKSVITGKDAVNPEIA